MFENADICIDVQVRLSRGQLILACQVRAAPTRNAATPTTSRPALACPTMSACHLIAVLSVLSTRTAPAPRLVSMRSASIPVQVHVAPMQTVRLLITILFAAARLATTAILSESAALWPLSQRQPSEQPSMRIPASRRRAVPMRSAVPSSVPVPAPVCPVTLATPT